MKAPWKGFVFLDVNDDLLVDSHDLGHGLTLRKARLEEITDRQVEICLKAWSERRGTSGLISQRMPKAQLGDLIDNHELWRHAVVECSNKEVFFGQVNLAFSISRADLRMGLILFEGNAISTPFIEFPMLNVRNLLGAMFVDHKLPSKEDLPELKENIAYVISRLGSGLPHEIEKMMYLFTSLDQLLDSSGLKILGYFSVIEGLLSHAPLSGDRVDSIQRQLIRNINLLNNRLKRIGREIPFGDFGSTKPKKILESLYAYRSAIAHGGSIKGPIDDINNLRVGATTTDHLWIHDWLRTMTKELILAAVVEPDLVSDLR
jgi:hypothetical protein